MVFSNLAENMIGSEIVKLGNAIRERIRLGETIYNFTIGDFDSSEFPIPPLLEQYICEAYAAKQTTYPLADGERDLREAIQHWYKATLNLNYDLSEIQVASGGRPLIFTIFQALIDPGDKVIYAAPSWNNNHYTTLTRGEHVVVEALPENDFMPTAAQLEPHIKNAALICLCTPQNPTGTTLPLHELEKICALVLKENERRGEGEKKLYIMYDQMYCTLMYGNAKHHYPVHVDARMKEYTIYVDGISKCFAATGVRVGWSCGPAPLIAKMRAILSHIGAWAPTPEQKATARFLNENEYINGWLAEFKSKLEWRLNEIYKGFMQLKEKGYKVDAIAPQAAIYLTVRFDLAGSKTKDGDALKTQDEVTDFLLQHAGLAIVPFYAFGGARNSPWYRLSVGTCREKDIDPMLERLERALEKVALI